MCLKTTTVLALIGILQILLPCTQAASFLRTEIGKSFDNSTNDLLPSRDQCGRRVAGRVVGGHVTEKNEFPWLVYTYFGSEAGGRHCAGTLISQRYVVTAAHCIYGLNIDLQYAILGCWENPSQTTTPEHLELDIEETILHPQYNQSTKVNDIALIRLVRDVAYTPIIQPICLPDSRDSNNAIPDTDNHLSILGWGITENGEVSPQAKVCLITRLCDIECPPTQICAYETETEAAGHGDSGGPLQQVDPSNNRAYVLEGVVAHGKKLSSTNESVGVYTRVGAYVDWIKENMKA